MHLRSCKKYPVEEPPPNETNILSLPSTFLVSPLEIKEIRFITPLGNLNPPGHTLPTSHIYFYFTNPDSCPCDLGRLRTVVAPAGGKVQYGLTGFDGRIIVGTMAVQMIATDQIKVETFLNIQPPVSFTANAQTYTR